MSTISGLTLPAAREPYPINRLQQPKAAGPTIPLEPDPSNDHTDASPGSRESGKPVAMSSDSMNVLLAAQAQSNGDGDAGGSGGSVNADSDGNTSFVPDDRSFSAPDLKATDSPMGLLDSAPAVDPQTPESKVGDMPKTSALAPTGSSELDHVTGGNPGRTGSNDRGDPAIPNTLLPVVNQPARVSGPSNDLLSANSVRWLDARYSLADFSFGEQQNNT